MMNGISLGEVSTSRFTSPKLLHPCLPKIDAQANAKLIHHLSEVQVKYVHLCLQFHPVLANSADYNNP
jgi:hypothetical protein